eukprot:CAMPEP_0170219108 /NCGR_PEP_ID=MMETSP0116_2-20130129/9228_1 /TAXON_ID=400756 /ORGANISM="Durinskia baltica, Strain CSIRO CS-38" /LENGTH=314 /DNA_ID=CAMNT_0010469759 /DNA_START=28 /DNA_END=969 /DNA_ORIENTATION=+
MAYIEDIGFLAVGSPQKLLRTYHIFVATALASAVAFVGQIIIVLVFATMNVDNRRAWYSLFPQMAMLLAGFSLCTLEARILMLATIPCARIVWTFNNLGVRVADQLLAHARDDPHLTYGMRCAIMLAFWCFLNLLYEAFLPPCSKYNTLSFWDLDLAAFPCESWELVCSITALANATVAFCIMLLPRVVARLRPCYCPLGRKGLPAEMLELLPCFDWGSEGTPAAEADGEEPTCSICIEEFQRDDTLRQLPCGHFFHKACVDSWLAKKPTCPLRCHDDVWQAVRNSAHEKGIPVPPVTACFEIPPGATATIVGR